MEEQYEAVIIGSGFGGAITGCRLARKWGKKVLIMERGKRYPMGSFPRTPRDLGRNFWYRPNERATQMIPTLNCREPEESHGMFDVRNYRGMDALVCAGLGGGSLIYANIFLEPPTEVFDERWPASCKKDQLKPYYKVAKEVLGARPIPKDSGKDDRRYILRTKRFQETAKKMGRESHLLDLIVFFGNDFDDPLPIGEQDRNRYGALQTSCTYCAECDIGCNYHSKNTVDLNYLFVAENRYQAEIRTEHLAEWIVPVNEHNKEDRSADGSHGYRLYYRDLTDKESELSYVLTRRVILSAGAMGSTELLLRCRDHFKTLPDISSKLGHSFSGNGDFLTFAPNSRKPIGPNYGPVITQAIDFNLLKDFDKDRAFVVEDASYPAFLAWLLEGLKPRFMWGGAILRTITSTVMRLLRGRRYGSLTYAARELLADDLSHRTAVLLSMGVDKSNGVMTLGRDGSLDLDWPYKDSLPLYRAILKASKEFARRIGAQASIPVPTWLWPSRNNVTVHALGGCILGNDASKGVTSADRKTFGQVFNYKGLYVADGALPPSAVGANPIATISALSEMVAQGITDPDLTNMPDADL